MQQKAKKQILEYIHNPVNRLGILSRIHELIIQVLKYSPVLLCTLSPQVFLHTMQPTKIEVGFYNPCTVLYTNKQPFALVCLYYTTLPSLILSGFRLCDPVLFIHSLQHSCLLYNTSSPAENFFCFPILSFFPLASHLQGLCIKIQHGPFQPLKH